jgi:signal transduction histidine kinase
VPIEDSDTRGVFERFYRVEAARTGENMGAGLGLSVAKWAVEANDGEIGVKSSFGAGSIFWIRLAAERCPSSQRRTPDKIIEAVGAGIEPSRNRGPTG